MLPRAFTIGAFIFPAFLVLELPSMATDFPEVPWAWALGWRLFGSLVFMLGALLAVRVHARYLLATASATMATTAVAAGLVSWRLGGTESPVNDAMAFYFVGAATLVPTSFWRSMALVIPTYFGYFGIIAGLELARGSFAMTRGFANDLIIQLGISVFAAAGAHILWASRQQLYRARRLGRYRLEALIGRSAMSEVWRAVDGVTPTRTVALKIVRTERQLNRSLQGEFEREARAASALTSEHTIRIYDYGASDDGLAWLAMEALQGEDLEAHVHKHGPLDPRRAIHIAKQMALSLIEAHQRGLVHGDIKPSNVFVLDTPGEEDVVKVLDWGVARDFLWRLPTATQPGLAFGTPAVMAPEAFTGATSPRTDIYAFGATLYWFLTGRYPVTIEAGEGVWSAHRREQVVAPSMRRNALFPAGLDLLVLQCLAKEPEQRPNDMRAVLNALKAIPVEPWGVRESADRWSALRPQKAVAAAPIEPDNLPDPKPI